MEYLDLKAEILKKVKKRGGFVNTHAHIDRAFTLSNANFEYAYRPLQDKWALNDELKRTSTVQDIYDRMAFTVEGMLEQGVTALGTFIDIDDVVEEKAMQAAAQIREKYKGQLEIRFINQVLKGVLEPEAYKWFRKGAEFVDIIGGLPGKDKGREAEHLDVLMETGKELNKMVHIHVDQLNSAEERETELLAKKTLEHGMDDRVMAIHGISLAAHKKVYREKVYRMMKDAGVGIIACPIAWIDSRRTEILSPTHNAVTPVEELIPAGVTVALGTDNIADIYKPFSDGNMWTELRFLLESCHYYEIDELVKIATTNGRKVLGLIDKI